MKRACSTTEGPASSEVKVGRCVPMTGRQARMTYEEVTDMKIRAYRLMCSTTAVSALVALLAAPKKW